MKTGGILMLLSLSNDYTEHQEKKNSVRNKLYEVYKFKQNYNTAEKIPFIIIN